MPQDSGKIVTSSSFDGVGLYGVDRRGTEDKAADYCNRRHKVGKPARTALQKVAGLRQLAVCGPHLILDALRGLLPVSVRLADVVRWGHGPQDVGELPPGQHPPSGRNSPCFRGPKAPSLLVNPSSLAG